MFDRTQLPIRALALSAGILSIALVVGACSQPAPVPTTSPTKAAAPAATSAPGATSSTPTAAPAKPTAPAATAQSTLQAKTDYPTKPITYIIPWAAGGPMGTGVLIMGAYLEKELGQQIQLVYKPGATGQVGLTEFVATAKPDGYILTGLNSPNSESTWLDPERQSVYKRTDFAPIALQVLDPNTFSVRSDSPYKTLDDVIKAAKDKPESVLAGDGGLMSDDHLALLLLQKKSGAKFAMSHFDGGAPTRTALQGGHIEMMVGNIVDAMVGYKDGTFRVLGIASEERSPLMPDVPTMKEQGYDILAATARGWVAKAGTPPEVIQKIEAAMKKVDAMPEYREKMEAAGLPVKFLSSAEYDEYLKNEEARVAELLNELKETK